MLVFFLYSGAEGKMVTVDEGSLKEWHTRDLKLSSYHKPPLLAKSGELGSTLNTRKGRQGGKGFCFVLLEKKTVLTIRTRLPIFLHRLKSPLNAWIRQCCLFGYQWSLSGFYFWWKISWLVHNLSPFGVSVICNFWEWQMSAPWAGDNFFKSVCIYKLTQTELQPTGGKDKSMLAVTGQHSSNCSPCTGRWKEPECLPSPISSCAPHNIPDLEHDLEGTAQIS
jgi:hypothetical protein